MVDMASLSEVFKKFGALGPPIFSMADDVVSCALLPVLFVQEMTRESDLPLGGMGFVRSLSRPRNQNVVM